MSNMSFREQVALATMQQAMRVDMKNPQATSAQLIVAAAKSSVIMAQALADAACEARGHEESTYTLSSPGVGTLAAGGVTQQHSRCARCGTVLR